MERRQVSTPKAFFESERDRFYSEWTLSFWRELFQNSVDAGARNIDITIDAAPSRGAFDAVAPELDGVTRVVFADDGHGMTQEVLDKVYFSVGASTKQDGDNIGGYGRARLMTCFSNVRYSILTTDRFVMGDGPDWVNYDLGTALSELAAAEARLTATDAPEADRAVDGLRSDAAMISESMTNDGYKGCRIEVDLDPTRGPSYRRPGVEHMLARLQEYLGESQLSPKVTINGMTPEECFRICDGRLHARRGPVRRVLSAEVGGQMEEFANVHLSEGAKAGHKGKVIVRVDGASMFVETIRTDVQVIIELHKGRARDVMTSNRDGLKTEYRNAMQALLEEIAIDNMSALRERKPETETIAGEKGSMRAERPRFETMATDRITVEEIGVEAPAGLGERLNSEIGARNYGLPIENIESFMRALRYDESFLTPLMSDPSFRYAEEFRAAQRKVMDAGWDREKNVFFENLSPQARGWLAEILRQRHVSELARIESTAAERRALADMHDVVVHVENSTPTIRAAMRRNNPNSWDVTAGKGRQPRSLLVAWTEACAVAVDTLMRVRPSVAEFNWTTGWGYDTPKQVHQGDRFREFSAEALHKKMEDGRHALLLNPITPDGKLAFNPSDGASRQRLQALAMHEVAHISADWHDETFANILTDLMGSYDFKEANRRMRDAVRAVHVAYEKGKARIQPMDDEAGPRPADRLLAIAAPGCHREGRLDDVMDLHGDGTRVVDCTALHGREFELGATFDESRSQRYA